MTPASGIRWLAPAEMGQLLRLSAAAFALLLRFFLRGPKQLVKSLQIGRVRLGQLVTDSLESVRSGQLDNLNDVGSVLHAVRTQLGFHPPGESCIAGAFANPQLLRAWDIGRCVLSRLATLGNDVNWNTFALQFVPAVR